MAATTFAGPRALTAAALVSTGNARQAGVYQTRLAASVHQKKMKEEEATPSLQQTLSAAVAGKF